jgi:hypothetical protein
VANTIFRPTNFSLRNLVDNIGRGDIALPELQRPFVWANSKVRDLFDSMYRGFPIGYLLFWETGAQGAVRQIGTESKEAKVARWLIVDGQQRMTSLFSVITGATVIREDYSESRVQLAFRPKDTHFAVRDITTDKNPEFLKDITQLWVDYRGAVSKFFTNYEASRGPLDERTRNAWEDAFDRVRDLQSFPFSVVELDAAVEEEQVAEVFVRINSEGVKLKQADFILTLMSVHWDEGRKQLEDFARGSKLPRKGPSPFNWYLSPSPDQLLRVSIALGFRRAALKHAYSILRGKDLETGITTSESRDEQFARLQAAQKEVLDLTNWHEYLKCLERAGYRGAKMISNNNAVLFSYAIWLIGRTEHKVPLDQLRETIARWFFMAHTTARYSGSFETQAERDFSTIAELSADPALGFVGAINRIVTDTLTRDFWAITMPNELGTAAAKSPALLAYFAALNILDADALLSSGKVRERLDPAVTAKKGIERHHLFPKEYLKRLGIKDNRQINQIANMALVEWSDNIAILDGAPNEYWPKQVASKTYLNSGRLARQEHLHALPGGWTGMIFTEFLASRRKLMAAVTREAFEELSAKSYEAVYPGVSPDTFVAELADAASEQQVTVLHLIEAGLLTVGSVLIPAGVGDAVAEVDVDGTLIIEGVSYPTPSAAGKVAAGTNVNGWKYWTVDAPAGERLLDAIRSEYRLANVSDSDDVEEVG